jgi:hypothetical protein
MSFPRSTPATYSITRKGCPASPDLAGDFVALGTRGIEGKPAVAAGVRWVDVGVDPSLSSAGAVEASLFCGALLQDLAAVMVAARPNYLLGAR